MNRPNDPPARVKPEQLAAYADGELGEAERKPVADRLARDPKAADQVRDQRQVTRLWQDEPPPEPSEPQWSAALDVIEAGLARRSAPRCPPASWGRRWGMAAAGAASIAAGLLLGLLVHGPGDEPMPVASPDEVEIISVKGADADSLVVGAPPVQGPIVLAAADDVTVESVEPARDGVVPAVLVDREGESAPLIVAPPDAGVTQMR